MNDKCSVLVVEDNESNLELFADFLDLGGYKCLRAATGEEAITIARKEHPDLVLLDIKLPGIDGLTVASILKKDTETQDIKVAALTAYASKGDRSVFANEKFDGYISKPVSMKQFLKTVDEILSGQCP